MRFAYVAIDDFGKRVSGSLDADSEESLATTLRAQGHHLMEARRAATVGGVSLGDIRILESVNRRDLIFFTSQLATVIGSGLDLVEGLAGIEAQTEKVVLRRLVNDIRRDVEGGLSLSAALAKHPNVFDDLYVNVVRSGEATGHADVALEDLVKQLEWQEDLRSRIWGVATYPIIVLTMLTALTFVLVRFTIPRFVTIYEGLALDIELPLPTRIVTGVAIALSNNWYVVLPLLASAFIALQLYRQTPHGAVAVSRFALGLPLVGELLRKLALSRFARYFSTLHQAGLEVAPSLALVERLIGNAYFQSRFRLAVDRVLAGEALSKALERVGEFPPLVLQMVALGERTGRIDKALKDVRVYFDQEIDRAITRSLTLFGPIMLVVLAGVFVLLALAFYLPLFQLSRGIT